MLDSKWVKIAEFLGLPSRLLNIRIEEYQKLEKYRQTILTNNQLAKIGKMAKLILLQIDKEIKQIKKIN